MMPTATESTFYLPDIDISAWLKDPASEEAEIILGEVRKACTSTGFFQLTGHGLPPSQPGGV